jgi:hypothetical protein
LLGGVAVKYSRQIVADEHGATAAHATWLRRSR